jgi:hypothetical protein
MATTSYPLEELDHLVRPLIGLVVAQPWKGIGSTVFLELGVLSWREGRRERPNSLMSGEASIMMDWEWRVESGSSVLYGSSNTFLTLRRGLASLQGTRIEGVSLDGEVPELMVAFSNGHRLRSMVLSTSEPTWVLRLPAGGGWLSSESGILLLGDGTFQASPDNSGSELKAEIEGVTMRWGVPLAEPVGGPCYKCRFFVDLNGEYDLRYYGGCASNESPFDGRIVSEKSGCPAFTAPRGEVGGDEFVRNS